MKPLRELPRYRGGSVLAIEADGGLIMLPAARQRLFEALDAGDLLAAVDTNAEWLMDPFDLDSDDPLTWA
jgi:hypothetical protein